jgi:flagellar hook-associated protein 3 FlgL
MLRVGAGLRDIEQYRRNATSANLRLSAEETALEAIQELLDRATEIAHRVASGQADDPTRQSALAEVEEIQDQIISMANTRLGNEYVFGGARSTQPPFEPDGTYVGDSTVLRVEIDEGLYLPVNHTGDDLFSDALKALDDLSSQVLAGGPDDLRQVVTDLESAQRRVLTAQTEVGVRQGQIKSVMEGLARRSANLQDHLEAVRDADPTESVIKLITMQTALERAYEAISRVLSTDLTDHLR